MKQAEAMKIVQGILPGRVVTDPTEFNDIVARLDESGAATVLCATRYIDHIPQYQAVSFRVILLGPDDFYEPRGWGGDGALAPKGTALMKLFREAGGELLPSERTDDNADDNVVAYRATVRVRQMDGRDALFSKERRSDLRPGSPEAAPMKPKQVAAARANLIQVVETKAQQRAMRAALGIEQAYPIERAALPMVIPKLVAHLDMHNEAHANLAAAHALRQVDKLYGARRQNALPPAPDTATAVIDATAGAVDTDTGEVIEADVHDEPAGFDPGEFADAGPTCGCPCGCAEDVPDDQATWTRERIGRVSCAACYPGHKKYDATRHAEYTDAQLRPKVA